MVLHRKDRFEQVLTRRCPSVNAHGRIYRFVNPKQGMILVSSPDAKEISVKNDKYGRAVA